ncbi:uncharacterized protein LOC119369488 [Jatropha curcas]|uniref:uncharacterized protein LOC119369488 n=1 Tax=Jatropha curcas TaxID=180498 RepID=UPI001895F782|nr:uncharacterized protein LOC119369488 [Jatropha curcas]
MVTLPEKFEAKISSLEDTWNMSQISLNVLLNALQAVEQRKAYREEETLGEKALNQQTQAHHAQITENSEKYEEQLFTANEIEKCDVSIEAKGAWLVDSGCTNHMKPNLENFDSLDANYSSKVRLGDGRLVDVKGKGDVIVQTPSGTKHLLQVQSEFPMSVKKFDEKGEWNWSKMEPENSKSVLEQDHFQQEQELPVDNEEESNEDDYAIRGTRSLEKIYSRCNVVSLEPTQVDESLKLPKWRAVMEE